MIGLLIVGSSEKMSERSDRMTRFIILELMDDRCWVKIKCTFFGGYVDVVNAYLAKEGDELPVVVVQFARVKAYKGEVALQNVMNTTKIMWNPGILEALDFKKSLAEHGFDTEVVVGAIGDGYKELSLNDDFLVTILRDDAWWYSACSCLKVVNEEDGVFFCLDVEFLLGKSCADFVAEAKDLEFGEIPEEFNLLVGKELLFKVDKGPEYAFRFDDTFRVRKVRVDTVNIDMFKEIVIINTPKKNIFVLPFPALDEASSSGIVKGVDAEVVDLSGEVELESDETIKGGGAGMQGVEKDCKVNACGGVDPLVNTNGMAEVVGLDGIDDGDIAAIQTEKPLANEFNLKKNKNLRLKKVKIEHD
ncbi:Nucleic acid-binding, OB-fold [Sesbania bispinosa]|nr:Nucleic acid-binding, OB-fold [Sesbania bispinosa]